MAPLSLLHPPYWLVLLIVVYVLLRAGKSCVLALSEYPAQWVPTPMERTATRFRVFALFDFCVLLYVAALLVVHL
jgi:hypothetical protein